VTTRDGAESQIRLQAKKALRKQMRAVRAALPESACETRSREIATRVLALDEVKSASTVLSFASIRNEARTGRLNDALRAQTKRILFPRVVDQGLELRLVESAAELVEGAFGVPEPPDTAPRVEPSDVDFALVPALAVDPRGYRIGYGGGYYDRLLPLMTRACACVLAYDFQLVAEVPDLPLDVAADLVVTDARVIRPR
jgi:5-formyltetrahydrofolate cyclo-ligase